MNAQARSAPNAIDGYIDLFAFVAVFVFASVCVAAQFVRHDLDPAIVPLSAYLTGSFGASVRAAYYLLGAGLTAFAWASFRGTTPAGRSAAPAILFVVAGIALIPVAVTSTFNDANDPHRDLAQFVHGLAAQTTFLCVTVAMLLQSWRWRTDPAYAAGTRIRSALALLAFAALWFNVFNRSWPRGLVQKTLIVLILVWLGWATLQVWRVIQRRRIN